MSLYGPRSGVFSECRDRFLVPTALPYPYISPLKWDYIQFAVVVVKGRKRPNGESPAYEWDVAPPPEKGICVFRRNSEIEGSVK